MARRPRHAVGRVRLNRGHGVVVRFVFREKIGTEHGFRYLRLKVGLEFLARNLGEIIQRGAAGLGADFVDDSFAHERADADIAIGVAGDGMAHHRIDADEAGAGRNFHLADNRAGPAEDVRELALAAAGHGDLVHDAARRANDVVFRHLSEPRDARTVKFQIQDKHRDRRACRFPRRRNCRCRRSSAPRSTAEN